MPGTRYGARRDASKQGSKSVPGTRCGARSDASKQGAQIGARHKVRSQAIVRQPGSVPEFLSPRVSRLHRCGCTNA